MTIRKVVEGTGVSFHRAHENLGQIATNLDALVQILDAILDLLKSGKESKQVDDIADKGLNLVQESEHLASQVAKAFNESWQETTNAVWNLPGFDELKTDIQTLKRQKSSLEQEQSTTESRSQDVRRNLDALKKDIANKQDQSKKTIRDCSLKRQSSHKHIQAQEANRNELFENLDASRHLQVPEAIVLEYLKDKNMLEPLKGIELNYS